MDGMKEEAMSHPQQDAGEAGSSKSRDVPNTLESCKQVLSGEKVDGTESKSMELNWICNAPSWLESGRYVPPQKRLRLSREENVSKTEKNIVPLNEKGATKSTKITARGTEGGGSVEVKTENTTANPDEKGAATSTKITEESTKGGGPVEVRTENTTAACDGKGAAPSTKITEESTEGGGPVEARIRNKEADISISSGEESDDDEVSSGNPKRLGRSKSRHTKFTFGDYFLKSKPSKRKRM
ncbi:hypothetical protein M758_UG326600 [Ceratodon purpureus]|nr:hypothetical protein M758_UG326600 [Ceratodon purpureus]